MDVKKRFYREIWCLNSEFRLITSGEKAARARFRIHLSKLHTPQDCTASLLHAVFDFPHSSFSIPAFGWAGKERKPCSDGRPSLGRLAAEMP